jgi:hypothetical protein
MTPTKRDQILRETALRETAGMNGLERFYHLLAAREAEAARAASRQAAAARRAAKAAAHR